MRRHEMSNTPLIIMESPTKAHHIPEFTSNKYEGIASIGHIKDLPKNSLGITEDSSGNIDFSNIPYFVLEGKENVVKNIKQKSKGREVFLATDPDREGESIAYDIYGEIKNLAGSIKRIEVHQITPKGVKDALRSPRNINLNTVEAQRTRRFIDRLAGYKLTKHAAKALGTKQWSEASVGRTQSAALKMVYDRDMEIKNFKPEPYWKIIFKDTKGTEFASRVFKSMAEAEILLETIKGYGAYVGGIEKKREYESSPSPLTASTLQQLSGKMFGFSPKRTMELAQELYTNGHITYMRTDSVRISPETEQLCRSYLSKTNKDLVPLKPIVHKNSGGNSQDAHEAIHPTSMDTNAEPMNLSKSLSSDNAKLYTMIWNCFVASQCKAAEWDTVKVTAGNSKTKECLGASGKTLAFDGWRRILNTKRKENEQQLLNAEYKATEKLNGEADSKKEFTKPPAYYTEPTFLKALETNGVGRPATFAAICETILNRNYVKKIQGSLKLEHTDKGAVMVKWLNDVCPELADVKFTARMEDDLALIEEGKMTKQDVVNAFNKVLNKSIGTAERIPEGQYHIDGVDYSNAGFSSSEYQNLKSPKGYSPKSPSSKSYSKPYKPSGQTGQKSGKKSSPKGYTPKSQESSHSGYSFER